MTYDSKSNDKFNNNVVELITFKTGPNNYIHCTTHTEPLTIPDEDGVDIVYDAYPFDRKNRKMSNAFENDDVKIVVMANHPICSHYRTMPTTYDVQVIVRQGYIDNDGKPYVDDFALDYPLFVMGWVGDFTFDSESGEGTVTLVTIGDTLAAPTLTRNYQHSCPLRLYGPKCKAPRIDIFIHPLATEGAVLTMPVGWGMGHEPKDFVGGLLSFVIPDQAIEYRTVTYATDTTIRFAGSTANLSGIVETKLALGCPHNFNGCRTLHSNTKRYGGFPFMPTDNPVNKSQL